MAGTSVNGLALDMFFDEWDHLEHLEEALDGQFNQEIEETIAQVI